MTGKRLDAEESSFPRWRSCVNFCRVVSVANIRPMIEKDSQTVQLWTSWAEHSNVHLDESVRRWRRYSCETWVPILWTRRVFPAVWSKLGNRSIAMLSAFFHTLRDKYFSIVHKRYSSMFVIKLNVTKVPLRALLVGNVPKYSRSLWSLSVKFAFLFQILTIAAFCSVCRLVDFPFALSQKKVLFSAFPWLILSNYLNWSVKIKFNLAALLVATHSIIRWSQIKQSAIGGQWNLFFGLEFISEKNYFLPVVEHR